MTQQLMDSLDARLASALAPEPAPADLRAALLAESRREDQRTAPLRRFRPLLAAAAVVLFLGGGAALVLQQRPSDAVRTARGALRNFMDVHSLDFQGAEVCADTCTQWSRTRLGFDAPLPGACAGQPLRGGRACRVEGRPVAHYLLEDGRALYVFREPLGGCSSSPARALAVGGGLQARAWNEQGRGYVMVEPARDGR